MAEDARLVRLFVAINLPEAVRRRLAVVQTAIAAQGFSLRWARPEGIHLTLAFLGSTDASRIPAVEQAVAGAAARHDPFELGVRGLGCFPTGDRARPRVLWAGLEGELQALAGLQRDVALALRQAGVQLEVRPFQPHATLGRAQAPLDGAQARRLQPLLAAAAYEPYGNWMVQTMDLMGSKLQRGGSVYTVLRVAPLGRSSAPTSSFAPEVAGSGSTSSVREVSA